MDSSLEWTDFSLDSVGFLLATSGSHLASLLQTGSSPGWTSSSAGSVAFLLMLCRHLDSPEGPRAARTVFSVGLIPPSSIADLTVPASVAVVQVLTAAVDYW